MRIVNDLRQNGIDDDEPADDEDVDDDGEDGEDSGEDNEEDDDAGKSNSFNSNRCGVNDEPLDDDGIEMTTAISVQTEMANTIKQESEEDTADMTVGSMPQAQTTNFGQTPYMSKEALRAKIKIANLRADAMRLRQEAARRDAEAYELKAKMMKAELRQME